MSISRLIVRGARQHNLKNITVEIPRNYPHRGDRPLRFGQVVAGLRHHIRRRPAPLCGDLSAYARQFLDQMERPDVDSIEGLSPAISIEQKTTSRSPRSTVGTITEIYDYLRLLYASVGVPHCPNCGRPISRQSADQIVHRVMSLAPGERVTIYAPIVRGRKGEFREELEDLDQQGFRARIDGEVRDLSEDAVLEKRKNHTIEAIVDRIVVKPGVEKRLETAVTKALQMANGLVLVAMPVSAGTPSEEQLYSSSMACPDCGIDVPKLEPRSFSFNSSYGACPHCNGLGSIYDFDPAKIIVDWSKPLLEGGLGRAPARSIWAASCISQRTEYKIDLRKPFEHLTEKQQKLLLYGPERGEGPRTGFHGILKWLRAVAR